MKSLKDFSIPVSLYEKVQTGVDPFGTEIYKEQKVVVNNCLVSMVAYSQLSENNTTLSALDQFIIAIPKGDSHEWRNASVEFTLADITFKCKTNGDYYLGFEDAMPLMWHKQIRCSSVR